MFAVISHNGNQYKVEEGKEHQIDLMDIADEKKITFSEVLLISDGDKVSVGTPAIEGAKVEADFVKNISDAKVDVVKFKAKKRYKKMGGHRQDYTVIKVTKISLK